MRETETVDGRRNSAGPVLVLAIAGAKLLVQLLIANRYGIFRDELYYLACSEHLDAGYVDQPLIALSSGLREFGWEEMAKEVGRIPARASSVSAAMGPGTASISRRWKLPGAPIIPMHAATSTSMPLFCRCGPGGHVSEDSVS